MRENLAGDESLKKVRSAGCLYIISVRLDFLFTFTSRLPIATVLLATWHARKKQMALSNHEAFGAGKLQPIVYRGRWMLSIR